MVLARTLVIGLDGATFDLITPLIRAGHLPTLAKLMAQGTHGPLHSWPNMNSAAAWSSMVTGYNPGQHGVYDFGDTPLQRGHKWRPTTAIDRRKDPFWRLLSAAGQRVGVINVPISYPADPVNGFMLAGMDTPGIHSSGFAHPPELRDELRRQGIQYIIDLPNLAVPRTRDPHRVPSPAQRMVDVRFRTILHLMKTHPWDMLMAVCVAPDRVQHVFWPDERASVDSPSWTPVRRTYQHIDSSLGKVLEAIDDHTTVLLVSDHGFGPMRYAMGCLNSLFAQLGWLRYQQGASRRTGKLLKFLLLHGREIIPSRLQEPLARALPRLHRRAINAQRFAGIEWSHTQVFAHPQGEVFVNLRGREPEGAVSPEAYQPLRERVRDTLLRLTDPVSGRPVIAVVHRREDIYHGPYLEKAPDLAIEWNFETLQDSLCLPVGPKPIVVQPREWAGFGREWTGMHRAQGIFIAYGPSIKGGARVDKATIYDIAPTVLYLQGHPIPRDMDGTVLTDILTEERLRRQPIQHGEPTDLGVHVSAAPLDTHEARQIEERLRGLGYLE